jgi:hypothetical protein
MFFNGWGSNIFGHFKNKETELKLELDYLEKEEEIVDLSLDYWIRKTSIHVELHKMYVDEDEYWYQKSCHVVSPWIPECLILSQNCEQ